MSKLIKGIKINLYSIYSNKLIFIIVSVFISLYFSIGLGFGVGRNLKETINNIFLGANGVRDNFVMAMFWILYNLIIVIICGNFFYNELRERGKYIITKLKSKTTYLTSILLTNYIICMAYYLIGFFTIGILFNIFKGQIYGDVLTDYSIIEVYLLLVNQSFLIISIGVLITLIIKNHSGAILLNIIIMFLSLSIGGQYGAIDKFLPASQGVLIKHYINNFSFMWSMIYLFLFIIVCVFSSYILWKKKDLCDLLND